MGDGIPRSGNPVVGGADRVGLGDAVRLVTAGDCDRCKVPP